MKQNNQFITDHLKYITFIFFLKKNIIFRNLIKENSSILTHSLSGTVIYSLTHCNKNLNGII